MTAEKVKEKLGVVLATELHRLEISVSELARRAGVPQQTLHDYISGNREPGLSRVLAIEAACKRPAGWLSRQVAGE